MSLSILVEGKIAGRKQSLFTDWRVTLPPVPERGGDRLKLRDLITRVVGEEVEAFRKRQSENRLARLLSREAIAEGVQKGKIDSSERDLEQEVDLEAAVANALQSFEDGIYYVFLDGQQQTNLDAEVYVQPESKLTFLRLVPLAGG